MKLHYSPETQSRFGKKRRESLAGFSLIELLVVVSIIAILAGLTFAAWPALQASIKRKNTVTFLKEIEAGLENYKIDNATYPLNPDTGEGSGARKNVQRRDVIGLEGSEVLYKHLSGDYLMDDGNVDPEETVYVDKLAYYYTEKGTVERSFPLSGQGYAVVDPLGAQIRYIANAPGVSIEDRDTINPTFDLWSIVDGEGNVGTTEDVSRWITNWKDL